MELSLNDLKELISPIATPKSHSVEVGTSYLIRGVTMYYTGRVIATTAEDITLANAAWVVSTGRFSDALRTGELEEVEPFPGTVIIPRGTICDMTEWTHQLPDTQK